ncbi:DUF6787 family protein [Algibacter lectus]|uniref:DUF6787 domain-containing protein n=1 Tax=Algibacter lectus TaxID=221126 RepID=A0A4R8MF22_9FLAO|nr:DUF6787 family protein [Algibacter lectus]MWW23709.1 hypothetical protein [Algibacter lectus]TDY63608.1 hypothetical protein DFQ06_0497 [Algibacter lectus]SFC38502.1 hypothetical protein SAMN04489722_102329 [Algibacter lectus]
MQKFKANWQITKNWQLIFPFIGLVALGYSSFKLAGLFISKENLAILIGLGAVIFFVLLKFILKIFEKLEKKWEVNYRWELISIFLVFASTGSSSVFVSRPLIKLMGINRDNLPTFAYWFLYIVIGFIFYQILLVLIGWIFGQYKFFWNFEKKMLRRIGLKRLVD